MKSRHIIVKLLKTKDKEEILKAVRRKMIRKIHGFSSETMEARRQ